MADLFRKNALERVSEPEQLNRHIKIIPTGVYIVCLIFIIGLIAFVLWGFTYHFTSGINLEGVIFTNNDVVSKKAERSCIVKDVFVSEGEYINTGDIIAVVSNDEMLESISAKRNLLNTLEVGSAEYTEILAETEELVDSYTASTVVKSTSSGYIQSAAADGNALEAGDYIYSLMPDNGYNEVAAYVSMQTAKNLKLGMSAQISPSYAAREEYGYMTGTVISIGETPVSEDSIVAKMGTMSYVENILPDESCVEVRIRLITDADSANTYKWSNKKGEKLSVELGTQCSIVVVTDEYRPVELLLN
ncbi:MAG: hypothetical protein LUD77_04245 [Clostridiales bacterium]|nr:hypothetical protein [Clostridiales bacterium]